MSTARRLLGGVVTFTYAIGLIAIPSFHIQAAPLEYMLNLPNGQQAAVYGNGIAQVFTKDRKQVEYRVIPTTRTYNDVGPAGGLPDKAQVLAELSKAPSRPYDPQRIIVVFKGGVSAPTDLKTLEKPAMVAMRKAFRAGVTPAIPQYTNDPATNRLFAQFGVDRMQRMFAQFDRSSLSSMRSLAQSSVKGELLDFSNAYRLHITAASVPDAVAKALKLPNVAYASPDWSVTTFRAQSYTLDQRSLLQNSMRSGAVPQTIRTKSLTQAVPTNFSVATSAQSLLNSSSVDVLAAYDEIQNRFHQLPGTGETITNVSIGDLDDASAATNTSDPCNFYASVYGPTTEVISGQRYLNWPSMPLIPTYTADVNGNLSGSAEVCGVDPQLGEVGLDFSMMAPLPHNLQRPGEMGSQLTDLFGIAPGANFRLVVPGSFNPTFTDIDGALLGASMKTPRTDVITASLGFGEDAYGFPGRFLEDDPLSRSIVAGIVFGKNIAVVISANDGLRTFTNAAVGPNGGSAATLNAFTAGMFPTNLNDIAFSTTPSVDFDAGSIDAGGTTLDDIFAAPPQNPLFASLRNAHAFAETRWTGFTNFSSGYGSRVNVSAPSDNVLAVSHSFGGADDAVDISLSGGTSASAPETAAATAVALQVARLTGHPFFFKFAVRDFLAKTGTPVPAVSQADSPLNVGPQIDLTRAVETLIRESGSSITPAIARIGVEQRTAYANFDGAFTSITDPSAIDLQGPVSTADNTNTDRHELAWITIAPDWEGVPDSATYKLTVTGHSAPVLATTRFARLLPEQILNADGLIARFNVEPYRQLDVQRNERRPHRFAKLLVDVRSRRRNDARGACAAGSFGRDDSLGRRHSGAIRSVTRPQRILTDTARFRTRTHRSGNGHTVSSTAHYSASTGIERHGERTGQQPARRRYLRLRHTVRRRGGKRTLQ